MRFPSGGGWVAGRLAFGLVAEEGVQNAWRGGTGRDLPRTCAVYIGKE